MLTPEIQAEILSLRFGKKMRVRAIARQVGVNRKSVEAVIARRSVNLELTQPKRSSILDPFKADIAEMLKREPSIPAATILQRLRGKNFMGSRYIVQTYVRTQRMVPYRAKEAFFRLEFPAGECAQVDWGEFGDVFHDGIKIHCFLMVLCFSRLLYIEFTRSEKFEEFIRCHENAFRFFGELVPQECWYDNLASAVTERMGSIIRFNAKFLAYMGHHGIRPHACNPARGNEKGRVEDSVKYVRSSFWPAQEFLDFNDLNQKAALWRDEVANKREHRTTKKIPSLHFQAEEKVLLRPMNPHPYETDEIFSRVVPPNFHIFYDSNRYSVPWTLVGITVTIRVTPVELKIFYNERFITKHPRNYKKDQIISQSEHSKGLLERKPGVAREGWQLQAVKNIGPRMSDYVNLLRSGNRSLRKEVSKILALATVYGDSDVHKATEQLLEHGIVGVENLELILKSRHHPSECDLAPKPLNFQNSKLNRVVPTVDLRRYDALLFGSTHSNNASIGEENVNNPTTNGSESDPF